MKIHFLTSSLKATTIDGYIRSLYDDQVLDDDQGHPVVDYDQASLHLLRYLVQVARYANRLHWHADETTAGAIQGFLVTLQNLAIDASLAELDVPRGTEERHDSK